MRRGLWGVVAAATLFAASGALAADNTVKIGVNAALTGSFVSAGNTIHNAVKLAVKQINDAGGFVVDGKTYKLDPYYRDDRTDVNTAIANARELVDDIGVKAIWGTESHDFSIAMTKITNPDKVLQFTGNSSLGCCLTEESTKPGGRAALHLPDRAAGVPAQRQHREGRSDAARRRLSDTSRRRRSSSSRTTRAASICRPTTSSRSRPTARRPISSSSRRTPRTSRRCSRASRRTSPTSCTSGTTATS